MCSSFAPAALCDGWAAALLAVTWLSTCWWSFPGLALLEDPSDWKASNANVESHYYQCKSQCLVLVINAAPAGERSALFLILFWNQHWTPDMQVLLGGVMMTGSKKTPQSWDKMVPILSASILPTLFTVLPWQHLSPAAILYPHAQRRPWCWCKGKRSIFWEETSPGV